jgi:hypothetical protein
MDMKAAKIISEHKITELCSTNMIDPLLAMANICQSQVIARDVKSRWLDKTTIANLNLLPKSIRSILLFPYSVSIPENAPTILGRGCWQHQV